MHTPAKVGLAQNVIHKRLFAGLDIEVMNEK